VSFGWVVHVLIRDQTGPGARGENPPVSRARRLWHRVWLGRLRVSQHLRGRFCLLWELLSFLRFFPSLPLAHLAKVFSQPPRPPGANLSGWPPSRRHSSLARTKGNPKPDLFSTFVESASASLLGHETKTFSPSSTFNHLPFGYWIRARAILARPVPWVSLGCLELSPLLGRCASARLGVLQPP